MAYRFRFALCAAALMVAASAGEAAADRKVFLNGIDLEDVAFSDQKFSGCTVRFDAGGDVHITAPGFKIEKRAVDDAKPTPGTGSAKAAPAALTKRYFVANKGLRPGKVQFDIAVYINGKRVKTIRPGDRDGVTEITKYLKAGDNAVKLVAQKNLGKTNKRRSFSPTDEVEIVVGEGTVEKGVVTIRKTVLRYERNASETGTFTDSRQFRTR